MTVAELLVGVNLAKGRTRAARQAYVERLLGVVPVIPYDLSIAQAHADLLVAARRAGRPRGAHDLMIAATARATSRSVVTADPQAFLDLPGVAVVPGR